MYAHVNIYTCTNLNAYKNKCIHTYKCMHIHTYLGRIDLLSDDTYLGIRPETTLNPPSHFNYYEDPRLFLLADNRVLMTYSARH